MRVIAASVFLLAVGLSFGIKAAGPLGQPPAATTDVLFIDADPARGKFTRKTNFSKLQEQLSAAASSGYVISHPAAFSSSLNLLLQRQPGVAHRNYRWLSARSESDLVKRLNEAADEGFRLTGGSIKASDDAWSAIVEQQQGDERFAYAVIKDEKEAEEALAGAGATDQRLVGTVGRQGMTAANVSLFFEHAVGTTRGARPSSRHVRIVAAARTSAMQKDISAAAAEGYRLVTAGSRYMVAVMARDEASQGDLREYRLLAMVRAETGAKELNAAGSEGFRLAAVTENGVEAVFILERAPGAATRYEYELARLTGENAASACTAGAAAGYHVSRLLNDWAVLERAR